MQSPHDNPLAIFDPYYWWGLVMSGAYLQMMLDASQAGMNRLQKDLGHYGSKKPVEQKK